MLRGRSCVSSEKLWKWKILWPKVELSGRIIGSNELRESKNPCNGTFPSCQSMAFCMNSFITHLLRARYVPGTALRARTESYRKRILEEKRTRLWTLLSKFHCPKTSIIKLLHFLRLLDGLYDNNKAEKTATIVTSWLLTKRTSPCPEITAWEEKWAIYITRNKLYLIYQNHQFV